MCTRAHRQGLQSEHIRNKTHIARKTPHKQHERNKNAPNTNDADENNTSRRKPKDDLVPDPEQR